MSYTYTIKPQGARVLLLPDNKTEKVIGGVILPSAAQDDAVRHCKIVQWGKECKQSWCTGDTVMIGKDTGLPVKLNDTDYVLIGEDDILAVVTEDNSIDAGLREGRAFPVVAGDNYVAPITEPTGESFVLVDKFAATGE